MVTLPSFFAGDRERLEGLLGVALGSPFRSYRDQRQYFALAWNVGRTGLAPARRETALNPLISWRISELDDFRNAVVTYYNNVTARTHFELSTAARSLSYAPNLRQCD